MIFNSFKVHIYLKAPLLSSRGRLLCLIPVFQKADWLHGVNMENCSGKQYKKALHHHTTKPCFSFSSENSCSNTHMTVNNRL